MVLALWSIQWCVAFVSFAVFRFVESQGLSYRKRSNFVVLLL